MVRLNDHPDMTIAVDWEVKYQIKKKQALDKMDHRSYVYICKAIAGLILAQNDDGPLKWASGPYPIQIHANFQILMGHFEIFMGTLQNLMGPRIHNIHIRA